MCGAMFSSIRKAKILIPFFNQRLSDYAELARLDLVTFRNEMIASIVGAAIGAAALLFMLGFICVALIITEWDTPNRVRTAWIIAIGWGLITSACVYIGRFLMKSSSPFQNIGSEISLDLSVINSRAEASH
jgi:amino acid transporter